MSFVKVALFLGAVGGLVAPGVLAEEHAAAPGADHDDDLEHEHDHDHDHNHDHPLVGNGHGRNLTDPEAQKDCTTNPASPDCEKYEYPDDQALEDAKRNCQMMPHMVACDIIEACEEGILDEKNPHCDAIDLLASTCKDADMSGMAGCKVYTPMCLNASSVVGTCTAHPGVPSMVNTTTTVSALVEACAGSDLDGCSECTSQDTCVDSLETLNKVCQADSSLEVCASREAMCVAADGNLSIFCEGIEAAAEGTAEGSAAGVEEEGASAAIARTAATVAAVAAAATAIMTLV